MEKKLIFGICLIFGILFILNISAENLVNQNLKVFVNPVLNVSSPHTNGLYNIRQIPIEVETNGAIELKYSDNYYNFRTMCRKSCSLFKIRKPFDEGKHNLIIQSIYNETGLVLETIINFTVDTKKPLIREIFPTKGFANGTFNLKFQEINPIRIFLHYGNNGLYKNVSLNLNNCKEKNHFTLCSINVNLSDFNSQKILYWLDIEDIASNRVQSKIISLKVDFSKPVINSFNYYITKDKVNFKINVSEPNFDSIKFIDRNSFFPIWKIFCSNLKNGLCEDKRAFSKGVHHLDFVISDEAGNFVEKSITFGIK